MVVEKCSHSANLLIREKQSLNSTNIAEAVDFLNVWAINILYLNLHSVIPLSKIISLSSFK